MITPFVNDLSNGGVKVKGEDRVAEIVSKLFKPEEEIVEREIKRPLTKTPEEFAAQDQEDTQSGSRYFIKKALRDKLGRKWGGLYACPGCFERKELELYRVNKNGETLKESDYILLCGSCREKRQKERQQERKEKRKEEKKANRKWKRKYVKGDGSSKISFYNKIRKQVFERDGKECPYCGSTERLGLAPIRPESKGGQRSLDNFSVCCAKCRPAKGKKLPLDFLWTNDEAFSYWLSEQLVGEPVVKNPGARALINMHLVAEIQQYLHKIAAGVEIDRSKAERLSIRLSETDEDRKREREQVLW